MRRTSSITSPFSTWTMIANDAATSPDCAVAGGANRIVHVVTLSASGTVLDINGKESSWVVTDLGNPACVLTVVAPSHALTAARACLSSAGQVISLETKFGLSATPYQSTNQLHPARSSGLFAKIGCICAMTQLFFALVSPPQLARKPPYCAPRSRSYPHWFDAGVEGADTAARDQQVELILGDAAVVDDLDDHHLAVRASC